MSQENVDLVYRASDAFNRRDLDAFLALADPDMEYHSRIAELEGGEPYQGHEGIRRWWDSLTAISPDFTTEIEKAQAIGDMTLCRVQQRGSVRERHTRGTEALDPRSVAKREGHLGERLPE